MMVWACEEKRGCLCGRRVLEMELPEKRKVGRPKRRFMDAVKEGMKDVGVNEGDVHDRSSWRRKIRCGDP